MVTLASTRLHETAGKSRNRSPGVEIVALGCSKTKENTSDPSQPFDVRTSLASSAAAMLVPCYTVRPQVRQKTGTPDASGTWRTCVGKNDGTQRTRAGLPSSCLHLFLWRGSMNIAAPRLDVPGWDRQHSSVVGVGSDLKYRSLSSKEGNASDATVGSFVWTGISAVPLLQTHKVNDLNLVAVTMRPGTPENPDFSVEEPPSFLLTVLLTTWSS
ncbi:hypothetical protein Bbelb_097390 [Branchiostoma belcheri]|nr:hypothetical protein Bbelb_097390 [Branchiostoma belcheri]